MLGFKTTFLLASALLLSYVDAFSTHRRESLAHRNHPVRAVSAATGEQNITSRNLEKRFDGARFTFYDAGPGACGKTNTNSDFVVAINTEQYAGGSHCFETITITVGSKTHSAQIVDECEICPFAGLDFSRGLFDFFASESVGVLTGSWNFGGAAAPPKTTEHHEPPAPTTTHTATHASSTKHFLSSSSATVSASSVSGSATLSGSVASASATAAGPDSTSDIGNLQQLNLAYIQMASLVVAGGANGGGTS